jgi:hypothetical protein
MTGGTSISDSSSATVASVIDGHPEIRNISPHYARLSGEIADEAIFDNIRAVFPRASIRHAYPHRTWVLSMLKMALQVSRPHSLAKLATASKCRSWKLASYSLAQDSIVLCRHTTAASPTLTACAHFGDIVEWRGDRY